MRRILITVLVAAAAVLVLGGGLLVGTLGWFASESARAEDGDERGADTLDRADVERLSGLTLPAGLTGLHTDYEAGIDYRVQACFRVDRTALPALTAQLPALGPVTEPPPVLPGCPDPAPAVTGTPQHRDGPLFRTVAVSDPGDGTVLVYVQAFTT